ncbi:MAG: hypothetical protein ABIS18_09245, partial [Actinomycetota bacterium]
VGPEAELTSRLAPKRVSLVASVVTEAELLVAPLRTGDPVSIAVVRSLLDGPAGFSVVEVLSP